MLEHKVRRLNLGFIIFFVSFPRCNLFIGHNFHPEPMFCQGNMTREKQKVNRYRTHDVFALLQCLVANSLRHEVPLNCLPVQSASMLTDSTVGKNVGLNNGFQTLNSVFDGFQLLLYNKLMSISLNNIHFSNRKAGKLTFVKNLATQQIQSLNTSRTLPDA